MSEPGLMSRIGDRHRPRCERGHAENVESADVHLDGDAPAELTQHFPIVQPA